MNEVEVSFSLQSPQKKNTTIDIMVSNENEKELLYKFNIGMLGIWTTLRDFNESNKVTWTPKEEGEYHILVQAITKDGAKAFNYFTRSPYVVGKEHEDLIKDIQLNNNEFKIGDNLEAKVITSKNENLMYKYYLKVDDNWEFVNDYSVDDTLSLPLDKIGEAELLVQVKEECSLKKYDDSKLVKFSVEDMSTLEIINIKCLTENTMFENRDIEFEVEVNNENKRRVLYKFFKIYENGKMKCIQNYSIENSIVFREEDEGDYRLLCAVKYMGSKNDYDDRALINYSVRKYNEAKIIEVSTDVVSPQYIGEAITIKVLAEGESKILYRFKIEGDKLEDSGYIEDNAYKWNSKKEGNYKITVMVKNEASQGARYEDVQELDYVIEKPIIAPIEIKSVECNKNKDYVKGETVSIYVDAEGGLEPLYSFILYDEKKVRICNIDYDQLNSVNFTPEYEGIYELEVRVKDKYSSNDYDCKEVLSFVVREFLPANIECVLKDLKDYYTVDDTISLEIVSENTSQVLVKYNIYIHDNLVEETDYSKGKRYDIKPKCGGKYRIEILAKNVKSNEEYDCKKEINIFIHESMPIKYTKIKCDNDELYVNESINFDIACSGGKDVCYEFYLMEKGEWKKVQNYSKKKFYSFIPFSPGEYKLLALAKNYYKNVPYEDYDVFDFNTYVKIDKDTNLFNDNENK